ncbi:alkaline phosphatase [sulfur-oxidizing endosymbiont of Gigantopelta aegis]|uniref:alkaline phosphatase n=1 Tax=sulfur-oxidizing endosymbiont of Gigantopelta aegis TaxID=2794934 RepID=UPI0018DBBE02|nr:alkaline phosphatase [sulfur-oxidizing endosymbiont of Gigantopelta aegis]
MKLFKCRVLTLLFIWAIPLLSFASTSDNFLSDADSEIPPKNIIIFIGDGMGIAHISAGKIVKGQLNLEQFKHIGLLTTHSQDALVTDSAAAGTAIATGYKTINHFISVTKEGKPLKTIMEYAQEANKATGIVVTSSITHATPAAFMAHVDNRKKEALIAKQISESHMDVLFGGGRGYFIPGSKPTSLRNDEQDLLLNFPLVISSEDEFNQLGDINSVVGLFAINELPKVNLRRPGLVQMTQKAISILAKNKQGFVLMVEGSQIDWGSHANEQDYLISEMLDFDEAVGVGLNFAKTNSQTLIIVLSDHETGGFAIHNGSLANKIVSESSFSRIEHTAEMVPIFSYGKGAKDFTGIIDNAKVGQILNGYLRQK